MKKNIDVEVRMVYDGDLVPWIQDDRLTNQKHHIEIARIERIGESSRPSYLRWVDENGKEDCFVNPDVNDDDSENVVKQKVVKVLKDVLSGSLAICKIYALRCYRRENAMARHLCVLVACIIIACPVYADKWTDANGVTWSYMVLQDRCILDQGTSTIVGEAKIPSNFGGIPLRELARYALFRQDKVTSFEIPNSITNIGDGAFGYCSSITFFNIPSSVKTIAGSAFEQCSSMVAIHLPESIEEIGTSAFGYCSSLVTLQIPPKVKVLPIGMCRYCESLVSVSLPAGLTAIGSNAFGGCENLTDVSIPQGVSSIGENAFNSCANMRNIQLPPSVQSLGRAVFSGCSSLESLEFPDQILSVSDSCCNKCSSLHEVLLPKDVMSIGSFAFSYCTNLSEITIPKSVVSIAEAAFNNCKKLKTIVFEGPVPSGLSSSYILKYATKVYYPEVYAAEWRNHVGSEQFAGFVDDYWTDVGMVALPSIEPCGVAFDGASQEVTISCATEGATVYYTIDGSEPSVANGRVYKAPFNIYDSVTVKAIAVKDDWKDSAVASAAFTKNNGLSAAINMYDYLPDNDANAPWMVVTDVSHDGVKSARSGAIGENGVATMKVTVRGAGRLSFWWKSECEAWDEDYYDYGAFCVGSETEPRLRIAGMTDWKREEIVFDGTGKHVCKWEYHKDDAETIPRDCIWVDQVQWLPYGESEHDHTLTTDVPVPYLWLDSYGLGRDTDFETAAKMKLGKVDGAGRAMSVEDDYVAGTDPTNLASKLTATIKMGADGKPIVSWKPPLNGESEAGTGVREGVRSYSVYGKRALDDAAEKWTPVAEGDEENYRFFKVGVGMPEKQ